MDDDDDDQQSSSSSYQTLHSINHNIHSNSGGGNLLGIASPDAAVISSQSATEELQAERSENIISDDDALSGDAIPSTNEAVVLLGVKRLTSVSTVTDFSSGSDSESESNDVPPSISGGCKIRQEIIVSTEATSHHHLETTRLTSREGARMQAISSTSSKQVSQCMVADESQQGKEACLETGRSEKSCLATGRGDSDVESCAMVEGYTSMSLSANNLQGIYSY